jgi:hypothetical protein
VWNRWRLGVLGPAERRWRRLSLEDRAVVLRAFEDAFRHPHAIGDYTFTLYKPRSTGRVRIVHRFRVGFVSFVVLDTLAMQFLYDFELDEDIALAAE